MKYILLIIPFLLSTHAMATQSITAEYARELAEQSLASRAQSFVIADTKEYPFGWVFIYTSKRYAQTKNPSDMVPGTAPLIITRDGKTVQTSSSVPPDVAIETFAKDYKIKENRGY